MSNPALLSESLEIAPSQLYVADIDTMKKFYHQHVGLDILASSKSSVLLGKDEIGIIELISRPKLAFASPRDAGLFHNAVLFSSRGDLSRTVGKLIEARPQLYSGTGDHLVSEAFYFSDPEGNGLELYFDRPKEAWNWVNGQVQMDTGYIDPIEYIYKNASESSSDDRKIGHVHLKIGDISEARKFYVSMLGFTITAQMPGALFVSVAGYHHHIGLNTWISSGASKRQMTLGLSNVTITLNHDDDVSRLATRLEEYGYPFSHTNRALVLSDPWDNKLTITST